MNAFQTACRRVLDEAFGAVGLEAHYELLDYDETGGVDAARARYVRTQAMHAGRLYDLYVYEDEAGAHIENNWYLFEKRLFEGQDALVAALGDFTRVCLEGASPVDAYRVARQGRKEDE